MINGDVCINNYTKSLALYVRAEAGDDPKDDKDINIVLLDEESGQNFSLPLEKLKECWDIPNPRREPAQFTKALRDGTIKKGKSNV